MAEVACQARIALIEAQRAAANSKRDPAKQPARLWTVRPRKR